MCNKTRRRGTTILLGTELCGVYYNGWSEQCKSRSSKCRMNTYIHTYMRFRWSRGSVLDFGTQFRGFEVGYGFFRAKKILSTPFFGGEVKPSVPCRGFVACKRSLKKAWKSLLSAKFVGHFSPNSSNPRSWDLWSLLT